MRYQIYVDWVNTDDSPFIDIPMACVDIQDYFASLAHKANHSFDPNCRYIMLKSRIKLGCHVQFLLELKNAKAKAVT